MNLLSHPTLERIPVPPADGRLRIIEDTGAAAAAIPTDRRSNHAPSILSLQDGGLLAAWFGGSDEGNKDIDILVSRFDTDNGAWTASVSVTHDPIRSEPRTVRGTRRDYLAGLYLPAVAPGGGAGDVQPSAHLRGQGDPFDR
ncbi:hypothetical protein EB835_17865 [Brevibacterium sp. S22]|uniref:exo-alpha-sialidase n=1 Tax=Brevibacterium sp. S22 TaxID=2483794 RepID=UPI0010921049|nr:hypothetical protein EB835_17865 [Brevibacterium sp. S22]